MPRGFRGSAGPLPAPVLRPKCIPITDASLGFPSGPVTPLVLLFTLAFLVSVDLRILPPVLPFISELLGSTAGTVGLAMTAYAFAYKRHSP